MTNPAKLPYPPPRTRGLRRNTKVMFNWLFVPLAALIIALIIAAGVMSGEGRNVSAHWGPLPSGVTQLDLSDYLIYNHNYGGTDLCWDSNSDYVRVATEVAVPSLHGATFVRCGVDQTWNDHTPNGISFWHGALNALEAPILWISTGIAFLLFALPGFGAMCHDLFENRRNRRTYAASAEDVRRELRVAFAKGEITMPEIEKGLSRVYNVKGVEIEKDPKGSSPF